MSFWFRMSALGSVYMLLIAIYLLQSSMKFPDLDYLDFIAQIFLVVSTALFVIACVALGLEPEQDR